MSLAIIASEQFKNHDTDGHPESPERISAILNKLEGTKIWKEIEKFPVRKITESELLMVHGQEYISKVKNFCKSGGGRIDEDTVTCSESFEIAGLAAGSALSAVDLIEKSGIRKVFSLVRPPGHHALANSSMGFCLFSNLSLSIKYAVENYNYQRIMVIDWDAHHGNGTERIFYNSNKVFTVSWHQFPFWPFSGNYKDIGFEDGYGYNLNIPLVKGSRDQSFIETFDNLVLPAARLYRPEIIFVAAGYDAHINDPLAGLAASSSLYEHLTKRVVNMAEELCNGKLIASLEGGYNLEALAEGVYSSLKNMYYPDYNIQSDYQRESSENQKNINRLIDNILEIQPLFNSSKING